MVLAWVRLAGMLYIIRTNAPVAANELLWTATRHRLPAIPTYVARHNVSSRYVLPIRFVVRTSLTLFDVRDDSALSVSITQPNHFIVSTF